MHTLTHWFQHQPSLLRGRRRLVSSHLSLLRFGRNSLLLCCLGLLTCLFSTTVAQAKGKSNNNGEKSVQGVIVLVDRTNAQDVTFSLLDRSGTSTTFHLTAKTRFAAHQSASQLVPNLMAKVIGRPNASGDWSAMLVQSQRNTASLTLRGVVAAVHTNQTINLVLTDGAVPIVHLSADAMKSVHSGMQLTLQATFTSSNQLQAQKVRVLAQYAKSYQVRGILSHINTRTHRLSLLTSQGSTFSLVQPSTQKANVLHVGAKVTIRGNTDSQGNLNEQQVTVNVEHESHMELIATVTALDTTANTVSVVDQDGNAVSLNISASLLASLQVGTTYQFSVILASDGTLTVVKVDATDGSDQGNSLEIEGVVQSYDTSSNIVSVQGEDDQVFSIQVTDQTTIVGNDGTPATLQQGQAVQVEAQLNADGTYTALTIEIQDNSNQGDSLAR